MSLPAMAGMSVTIRASRRATRFAKISLHSSTLGMFLRKCWKRSHNFAFLLDSQAKIP
ncbi:hypothetical protein ABQJ54_10540 [Rhodanobacter sp. Si-c]|uniref:Uncharacterized protein n=1 Tax=Rhodanobacter lycopersici TaxID=3162487 RepID=A0ABV3QED3_9GAMM